MFLIFYVFVLSCVCYVLCASVYMCFVVTCWERADLLALVCGVFCEFVTFPLVSWVRCGTGLYRFLIFATLLLCFISNSCLFRPINLSTTLTSLSFLLFLNCFFLFTPDEKWVISGNLGTLIFPMTKSCAGSLMHNASVVPLKMDD